MKTKLSREGRWLDICLYLIEMNRLDGLGSSVGDYCRQKGLSKSPYIVGEFKYLVSAGILTEREQEYKSTVIMLYSVNMDVVAKDYPQLHQTLTAADPQPRLF